MSVVKQRDLYPGFSSASVNDNLSVDAIDAPVVASATDTKATTKSTKNIATWAAILIAVFIIFHIGRKE